MMRTFLTACAMVGVAMALVWVFDKIDEADNRRCRKMLAVAHTSIDSVLVISGNRYCTRVLPEATND